MGRPLRIEYPGALYHLMSRGNERKKIFRDTSDRIRFLRILEDYHERYGILVHSYVLMDNHYHLVMETPQGNLLKVMHGLNGGYTGYFNRKYQRSGHLFQGRYKGILIEKDAYLLELSRYVHLNPVRASIVQDPWQYRWSSCPGYFSKRKEAKWVEYAWILSRFGKDKEIARNRYKNFLMEPHEKEPSDLFKDLYGQVILGREEYVKKTKRLFRGKALSQEIAERKRFTDGAKPEDIITAVASEFGVTEEKLMKKRSRQNIGRKAAVYLIKRHAGLTNREIGDLFGGMHYSSVSRLSARLEGEMIKDRKLAERVRKITSKVKT